MLGASRRSRTPGWGLTALLAVTVGGALAACAGESVGTGSSSGAPPSGGGGPPSGGGGPPSGGGGPSVPPWAAAGAAAGGGAAEPTCGPSGEAASSPPGSTLPRNVIVFWADGLGPRHLDAARLRAGGPLAVDGMAGPVPYETTPRGGGITDSAAGASAAATGACGYNVVLSLGERAEPLETVLELAMRLGKRAGLVTNSYVLDASPAAFAAHVRDRYCEGDIARQILGTTKPDVVLGGWVPPDLLAPEPAIETIAEQEGFAVGHVLSELVGVASPQKMLGVFGRGPSSPAWPEWEWGMTPEGLRPSPSDEPTLLEMTELALGYLEGGSSGFFLFVESELADTIGHGSSGDPALAAALMPDAVLELDRAVAAGLAWVGRRSSLEETLVVFASDHETGGYVPSASDPTMGTFATTDHTGIPVPAYALGPGSEALPLVRHLTDLHRLITGRLVADAGASGCVP